MPISDFLPGGKPVFDASAGGAKQTSKDKYPPMDKSLLLVLANNNKITPKAMEQLLKEYTFDQAVLLYDSDDIVDETTFVIVTGKQPPAPKDNLIYSDWRDMPALVGLAAGPMSFNDVELAQSETWTISNDFRVSVYAQWRVKLANDSATYPAGKGEHELYVTVPPDGLNIGPVSDRKRTVSATGRVVRRWSGATAGYALGELEYRYVVQTARRTGG